MMSENEGSGCGCLSIIFLIIGVIILWGLLFGFTYNGHTYEINLSCDHGVEIDTHPTTRGVSQSSSTNSTVDIEEEVIEVDRLHDVPGNLPTDGIADAEWE